MSLTLTTPITGEAQTGLTTPTYTIADDVAPDTNGRQYAVTALGGTQTGVDVSSVSSPFTVTLVKPKAFKALGPVNPVTGVLSRVPRNMWKVITRKGVVPLSGQPAATMLVTTTIEVPAGGDTANPEDIRAALSCHFGALVQASSAIGDAVIDGTF